MNLKPGKELDKLIAEKVFGGAHLCGFLCPTCRSRWFVTPGVNLRACNEPCGQEFIIDEALPNYSTVIEDAWLVVEKLQELPPVYREDSYEWFSIDAPNIKQPMWEVGWKYFIEGDEWHIKQYGDTVMEAICKAALARVLDDKR